MLGVMRAGQTRIDRYLRRAALAFASLCLCAGLAAVANAGDERADAVVRAMLAGLNGGIDDYLLDDPATADAIAGRAEALFARLAALQPAPEARLAENVAETIARAGRGALRARPVLPIPDPVVPPPGAIRFRNDMAQVAGMRLPLPDGVWRILVFSASDFGREVMVNGRRGLVVPGAGVLVLADVDARDGSATVAFPTPRDLIEVIAEPAAGPSLLGAALPTQAETAAALARIDAALARAVPQRLG